jgi:hypothetical protein
VRLQLKFHDDVSPHERERVIGAAIAQGARAVRPLFPGARSALRASMFVVDCEDDGEAALLRQLDADGAVEYAEREARRRSMS